MGDVIDLWEKKRARLDTGRRTAPIHRRARFTRREGDRHGFVSIGTVSLELLRRLAEE